jgi:hypothetical protein
MAPEFLEIYLNKRTSTEDGIPSCAEANIIQPISVGAEIPICNVPIPTIQSGKNPESEVTSPGTKNDDDGSPPAKKFKSAFIAPEGNKTSNPGTSSAVESQPYLNTTASASL